MEWEDEQVGTIKGTGLVPRFSETPSKIWRGTTARGADNLRIYHELLGYSVAEVERMAANGVL